MGVAVEPVDSSTTPYAKPQCVPPDPRSETHDDPLVSCDGYCFPLTTNTVASLFDLLEESGTREEEPVLALHLPGNV
jgi:hypothetical protein